MAKGFRSFLLSVIYYGTSYIGCGRWIGGMGAGFREKVFIKVTFVNRCIACHFAHIGFGKFAGMSREEVEALADLDSANLDEKTLTALKYVEQLALTNGQVEDQELVSKVKQMFTAKQVRYIENGWIFADAMNQIGDKSFVVLRKLRLAPRVDLDVTCDLRYRHD